MNYFSKSVSLKIKGVAIILMVMHHVFALFSINNIWGGYCVPFFNTGISVETLFERLSAICVFLFAFITGAALSYSFSNKSIKETAIYIATKCIKFLFSYWIVIFTIFLPFYFCYFRDSWSFTTILKTLFGFSGFHSFSWYVYFYLITLITLPLYSILLKRNVVVSLIFSIIPFILIYLFLRLFAHNISHFNPICNCLFSYISVCLGYTFCKYLLFEKLFALIGKKILFLIIVLMTGIGIQVIYVFFGFGFVQPFSSLLIIIFLVWIFNRKIFKALSFCLDILGKNSMNIWFIHYLFFAPYIYYYIMSNEWILWPKIALFSTLLCLLISLFISLPYTLFDSKIISKIKIAKSNK